MSRGTRHSAQLRHLVRHRGGRQPRPGRPRLGAGYALPNCRRAVVGRRIRPL